MTAARPRQTRPELEHEYARSPELGYEDPTDVGFVRCLSHGFPTPLARWHYHDEYELHLITSTSGKAFVGDWIGQFQPGHLVLTGPRLPHNWVSMDMPEGGVVERDLVIQFNHDPLVQAAAPLHELVPGAQPQVEGVAEHDVGAERLDLLRRGGGDVRRQPEVQRVDHLHRGRDRVCPTAPPT